MRLLRKPVSGKYLPLSNLTRAPHIEVDGVIFDIYMVGRGLVAAHIDGIFLVVPVDCLL